MTNSQSNWNGGGRRNAHTNQGTASPTSESTEVAVSVKNIGGSDLPSSTDGTTEVEEPLRVDTEASKDGEDDAYLDASDDKEKIDVVLGISSKQSIKINNNNNTIIGNDHCVGQSEKVWKRNHKINNEPFAVNY